MCIFCKIINGDIPSSKIYEDEDVLAILDISQLTYGHTLVIPKKHYINIFDIDEDVLLKLTKVVKMITSDFNEKGVAGVNVITNAGEIAGQEVMHFHYHILPRYNKEEFGYKMNSNKYDLNEVSKKMKL